MSLRTENRLVPEDQPFGERVGLLVRDDHVATHNRDALDRKSTRRLHTVELHRTGNRHGDRLRRVLTTAPAGTVYRPPTVALNATSSGCKDVDYG